jgi:NAD(P)-dependent dehydrogenase (short-subunit alcohol dehydrogenase family)
MNQNLFDLHGRVAVVVGGATGLGRAIAFALASAGANVVPSSRRINQVKQAVTEIQSFGRHSLVLTSDVLNRDSIQALHDAVFNQFGKIDILVNAAAANTQSPTLQGSEKEWSSILETNLTGIFRTCQIFAPTMIRTGYGRIINLASLGSFVAFSGAAAYCASKAGVASLTKSLAIELASSGVNVNAIAPGFFPSPLNSSLVESTPRGKELLLRTPMHRFGKPQELAGTAVFLASEAASFITGEVIAVDGGFLASGVNQ